MRSKLLTRLTPLFVLALSAAPALAEETAKGGKPAEEGLLTPDYQAAIWVLVIFIVLAWFLYKKAWINVLAGLKGREKKIRDDIAQAEGARLKAEGTLKEYNKQLATAETKAQEILAQATKDAQALAERIKVDADKAATERVARATRDIEEARNQALRDIYSQAADLSTSIAEKILRRNLNPNDQRDLVAASLEQVQALNRG